MHCQNAKTKNLFVVFCCVPQCQSVFYLGYMYTWGMWGFFLGVCKHPWQVCIIRWKRSGLHITSKTDLICDVRFTGRQYSVCNFSLTLYIRTILFSPDKIVDTVAIKFLQCCVLFSERISFLPRGSCPCHVYSGVISEKKKGVKPCST